VLHRVINLNHDTLVAVLLTDRSRSFFITFPVSIKRYRPSVRPSHYGFDPGNIAADIVDHMTILQIFRHRLAAQFKHLSLQVLQLSRRSSFAVHGLRLSS